MSLYLLPILLVLVALLFFRLIKGKKSEKLDEAEPVEETKSSLPEPEPEPEPLSDLPDKPETQAVSVESPPLVAEPKVVKAPAQKRPKFSPTSPVIKKYETELNLQMIRAESAGDEDAYIEIVRKNAIYMKACSTLKRAVIERDREKIKATLIKIWKMIPQDFKHKE